MARRSTWFLYVVSAIICLWAYVATAQIIVSPPPADRGPTIEATTSGPDPIRLQSLDLRVLIRGLHAETTATLIVSNASGRDAEARVLLPLPTGAVVSGFALDVGGRMVDGVVVGRDQAQRAFEREMNRRIDPGIAELTEDGSCRCRIFPVPTNGARTFSVTWLAPAAFEVGEAVFRLPLPVGTQLDNLHISIEAADPGPAPLWSGFGGLLLTKSGNAYRGEIKLLHVTPDGGASIHIPQVPRQVVEIEASQGENYFFISETAPDESRRGPAAPGKIAIGWDASGSRSRLSVERDLRFLKDLLATWRNVEVWTVVFRDRPAQPRRFSIRGGEASALLTYLAGEPCDGGTDLSALDLGRLPGDTSTPGLWLLFTDGKSTLDSHLPTLGDVSVVIVSSDKQRNLAVLQHIAAVTTGAFIDLTSPAAGDGLAGVSPLRVDVQAPAGALSEIWRRYDPLSRRVTVVARLHADCEVSLIYRRFGKETARTAVGAHLSKAVPGSNLRIHWAAGRMADLPFSSGNSTKEIFDLAMSHRIVTNATSLLVLENIEQYLRYSITPPETWPEMREKYLEKRPLYPNSPSPRKEGVMQPQYRTSVDVVLRWCLWRINGALEDLWRGMALESSGTKYPSPSLVGLGTRRHGPPLGSHLYDAAKPCRICHDTQSGAPALRGASGAASTPIETRDSPPALSSQSAGREPTFLAPDSPAVAPAAAVAINPDSAEQPSQRGVENRPIRDTYAAYLEQRQPPFRESPSFFFENGLRIYARDPDLGLRVFSNLLENGGTASLYLWALVWFYRAGGDLDRAIATMEKLIRYPQPEPLTLFELAWLLTERMQRAGHADDGARAAELYAEIINRPSDLTPLALEELNHLLDSLESSGTDTSRWRGFLNEKLRLRFDAGLRVILISTADFGSIDLTIDGPSGARNSLCFRPGEAFGSQVKSIRECVIPNALPGDYRINVSFSFGPRGAGSAPRLITGKIYTNYSRPGEEMKPFSHLFDENVKAGKVMVGQVNLGAITTLPPGRTRAWEILIPLEDRPLFLGPSGAGSLFPSETYRCESSARASGEEKIQQERRHATPPWKLDIWGRASWGWVRPLSRTCYVCHDAGSAASIADRVFAAAGHQNRTSRIPRFPNGIRDRSMDISSLPYVTQESLECSSCHNVHVSHKPPFMQRGGRNGDFSSLCRTCHAGRGNQGKVGRGNSFDPGPFGASYSTHPTDVPVADIATNGPTIFGPVDPRLTVTITPDGPWRLGGKLVYPTSADAARAPFSCQTCHVVHGPAVRPDEELPGLLAIWDPSDPSALCIGCHAKTHPDVAFADGRRVRHPMGDDPGTDFYPDIFASSRGIPPAWASKVHGDSGAAGFDPCAHERPSCVSCHDVHGGLPGTSLLFGPNPVEGGRGDWCYSCHSEESMREYRITH